MKLKFKIIVLLIFFGLFIASECFGTIETFYVGTNSKGLYRDIDTSWTTARNSASALGFSGYLHGEYRTEGGIYAIGRGFLPFNTAPLPDNAIIDEAIIYVYYIGNGDKSNLDNLGICGASEPSSEDLSVDDYNDTNDILLSNLINFSTIFDGGAGWYNWTLTEAGLSYISKTEYTNFSLKSENDRANTTPDARGYLGFQWGTDVNKPYIKITYHIAEEPIPPSATTTPEILLINSFFAYFSLFGLDEFYLYFLLAFSLIILIIASFLKWFFVRD